MKAITKAKPRVLYCLGATLLLVASLCASCGATTAETSSTGGTSSAGPTSTTGPASSTAPASTIAPTSTTAATASTGPIVTTAPLLPLLAGIPQDPISKADDFIYFADYAAMESAYNATRPADAEEAAKVTASDQAHRVWWVVFQNSWSYSQYWLASLKTGPGMVGFSPLEVDQAIQFGVPPGEGLMLAGRFHADAIRTAYQANVGLAPKDFDGTTVWLWGEDPADGSRVDPSHVVKENPFGGKLGRRQPMIISDDLLMSSADLDLVLAHAGATEGTVPNLPNAPGYRAAVSAVSKDADVLQAAIAGPTMALNLANAPLQPPAEGLLSSETSSSTSATLLEGAQALPAFELLILADVVTGNEQIARVGLVYEDDGTAEAAAPILLDRLATYPARSGGSYAKVLTPSNGTGMRYYVREESDRAVLVLEFPAPRATPEEIVSMADAGGYKGTATRPGSVYRVLLNMFSQRDTGWLSHAGSN